MLILASNSPRRKQLLSLAGWRYVAIAAEIDENPSAGEKPQAYVLRLAKEKAEKVYTNQARVFEAGDLIVAADTTVAFEGEVFGKPTDSDEALRMLLSLRGRYHQVYTAIGILDALSGDWTVELCTTDVGMRDYTDQEIQAYIASGDPFDKAGAYAIQHPNFQPVETLVGCYGNVIGLPLCILNRMLLQQSVSPDLPAQLTCGGLQLGSCAVERFFGRGKLREKSA